MNPTTHHGDKPLRLRPALALMAVQLILLIVLPVVFPDAAVLGVLGAVVCGVLVFLWWLFLSRASWIDRIGALLLMLAAAVIAHRTLIHPSLVNGMMGRLFIFYVIPALSLAFVASLALTQRLHLSLRRAVVAVAILAGCGALTLLRTDGITGEGRSQFAWRWTPSAEDKLLTQAQPLPAPASAPAPEPAKATSQPPEPTARPSDKPAGAAPAEAKPQPKPPARPAEWPGFRGPRRDSVIAGTPRIATDWSTAKPVELWRKPVGPGWSSFAVAGNLLYTQEQRGEYELVSCYNARTGEPVWSHRDAARFWESNGGAGPRATPTLHDGRVYSFGATGILNALDAKTGAVYWTHNVATETGTKTPGWGFSSSPQIVDDLVIVAASGRLAAYSIADGSSRWTGPKIGGSYSSPHLIVIGGVPQIVLLSGTGATSLEPRTGTVLWQHEWAGSTILQPNITSDGAVLITTGDAMGGVGTRRLAVTQESGGKWAAKEVWTSKGLKPYFNDLVVHNGHAYGFDASILSCIDLQDGTRKWKGGRYGHGQMLLLPDQDLLLVLSEEGDLALVSAVPGQFTELSKYKVLEGKTWNHPVLVGDTVYVRNDQEMAAFKLALAPSGS